MGIVNLLASGGAQMASIKWDDQTPGLGIRLNKGGGVWIGKFRRDAKQVMITLGALDDLSYEQPRAELRQAKLSGAGTATISFRCLAERYIQEYAQEHKRTWREDLRILKRHVLPALGDRSVASISSDDCRALHLEISKTAPRQADKTLELVRSIFNRAKKWKLIPASFETPTDSIDWHKKIERERFITESEMPSVLSAILALPRYSERAIFLVYLLTGCRKRELVDLKWSEVDLDAGTIRLSAARNKSGHAVIKQLPDAALDILKSLPRDEVFVFPGRYKNTRMHQVLTLWRHVRRAAGIDDVVLHDLRRTTGSWLAQSGAPLSLIAKVLGQTTQHATKVYARYESRHAKQALDSFGDKLKGMISE